MISKTMRSILHALSYGNIDVESSRRIADLKKLDAMRIFIRKLDTKICNGDYEVPVRMYFPSEETMEQEKEGKLSLPVLLFFHGGGWVTESVDTYNRVCARMAQSTGKIVVSVEYRLAPEHRFPTAFDDCYAAAKELYTNHAILNADPKQITIIGDSAGGNLAAAVCLKARDTGDFQVERQILIYPALNNCYTEASPYPSVWENGTDYLLTAVKMEDYVTLYESCPEDRQNPYFAPLMETDYRNLPRTLLLTAELDPLRDEGEEYARRLKEAGNEVQQYRIAGAFHGFFALGIKFWHVQESFTYINQFLGQ